MVIEINLHPDDRDRELKLYAHLVFRKFYLAILINLLLGVGLLVYMIITGQVSWVISIPIGIIIAAVQLYRSGFVTRKRLMLRNKYVMDSLRNAQLIYLKITDLFIEYKDPGYRQERAWKTYTHYSQYKNWLLLYVYGDTDSPATIIDLNKLKSDENDELLKFVTSKLWKKN